MRTLIQTILAIAFIVACKNPQTKPTSELASEGEKLRDFERLIAGRPKIPIDYYNFTVEDNPLAKEGLDAILAGRVFNPIGIPVGVYAWALKENNADPKNPKMGDLADGWMHFGIMPSPPNRAAGRVKSLTGNFGLAISETQVGRCQSAQDPNKFRIVALPDKSGCNPSDPKMKTSVITENCFVCHGGMVRGTVVAGLANNQDDQPSYYRQILEGNKRLSSVAGKALMLTQSDLDKRIVDQFRNYIDSIILPIFKYAQSRGDNLGPYWVYKYITRSKDTVRHVFELAEPEAKTYHDRIFAQIPGLPAVDANPWWLLPFKDHVYRRMEIHREAKDFAYNFLRPIEGVNESFPDHVSSTKSALCFASQTKSPPFPKSIGRIDVALAKRGESIFHSQAIANYDGKSNCSSCHGSYAVDWDSGTSENVFAVKVEKAKEKTGLHEVGTDGEYSLINYKIANYIINNVPPVQIPNRPEASEGQPTGVIAPPLVGTWASAPFFHNGSVPTLRQVFKASERPKKWTRSIDPMDYDERQLGMKYKENGTSSELPIPPEILSHLTYDTSSYGKGNGGHDWLDSWSDDDIAAVMEFLKAVSGPRVVPSVDSAKNLYCN